MHVVSIDHDDAGNYVYTCECTDDGDGPTTGGSTLAPEW